MTLINVVPEHCQKYHKAHYQFEGCGYELYRTPNGDKVLKVSGCTDDFVNPIYQSAGSVWFSCGSENLSVLRKRLPWLSPSCVGLNLSVGTGDRLGVATPGHVRAFNKRNIFPIFAQQSVRENHRTKRSPLQVIEDVVWGLFQEGWTGQWGADADHLQSLDESKAFIEAGYTYYTIDASEFVQIIQKIETPENFEGLISNINFRELDTELNALEAKYCGRTFSFDETQIEYSKLDLYRVVAKYGNLLAHVVLMSRYINTHTSLSEIEVSVDETNSPTSVKELFFIINELHRLDVKIVGLAPRFVGDFEKGVDYIGNLKYFESELIKHAAIQKEFNDFKISLHSGSDKFSVYPLFKKHFGNYLHVKTSGTSYLEAMRIISSVNPELFRIILKESMAVYPLERQTYHVSADINQIPAINHLSQVRLEELLNNFHVREVLHVGYGTVLKKYQEQLMQALRDNEVLYHQGLEIHFNRHFDLIEGTS
jgi:tagaturonate epimerase